MTLAFEIQALNPHTKAHRNGNSSTFVSYIRPTWWKAKFIYENVDDLSDFLEGRSYEPGERLVNWDNGEVIAGGISKF